VRLLVTGSPDFRARRIMAGMNVDEQTALKTVERTDAERIDWYKRFYETGWLTPCSYDLRQHRPPEPRASGRNRARFRQTAIALAATLALALAGCGGGDDDNENDAAEPTPQPAPWTPRPPCHANGRLKLLPSLTDLCFSMQESGRDPGELAGMQSALALYRSSNPKEQVQLRIYVMPTPELARTQFDAFAVALRNPPPEFVGVQAKFVDADSPSLGESRKSYKTERADSQGYSAWSDVYLKGRTVVLVQVVDDSADGQPARQQAGAGAGRGA
jgi:hypothetical protein